LILGVKKWTYLFSSIVVVISVISLATNGLDEGVDFVEKNISRFEKPIETETVKAELAKVLDGSAEVKIL
jgi:SecD/SecF fusion protein